jgi:hypothetical protein
MARVCSLRRKTAEEIAVAYSKSAEFAFAMEVSDSVRVDLRSAQPQSMPSSSLCVTSAIVCRLPPRRRYGMLGSSPHEPCLSLLDACEFGRVGIFEPLQASKANQQRERALHSVSSPLSCE